MVDAEFRSSTSHTITAAAAPVAKTPATALPPSYGSRENTELRQLATAFPPSCSSENRELGQCLQTVLDELRQSLWYMLAPLRQD